MSGGIARVRVPRKQKSKDDKNSTYDALVSSIRDNLDGVDPSRVAENKKKEKKDKNV